jgi:hypothetical protein
MERYEISNCEAWGHVYEACHDRPDCDPDCKIRTCADCGDEYEED